MSDRLGREHHPKGMHSSGTQIRRHESGVRVRVSSSAHILIYNVMAKPVGYYAPFVQQKTETWNDVLSGNLTGAFIACREACQHLKQSNNASVILTSSTYGVVGPDNQIYEGLSL